MLGVFEGFTTDSEDLNNGLAAVQWIRLGRDWGKVDH